MLIVPNREYFSLRYAVPGFSFILISLGLNYSKIVNFLISSGSSNGNVIPIVISIISLFSGSAIGFLIIQIWFALFHCLRIYARKLKSFEHDLFKYLKWKPKGEGKDKDILISALSDYMLIVEKKEMFWSYLQRKWDLYHILWGTIISLILGTAVGLFFRFVPMLPSRTGADSPLAVITLTMVGVLGLVIFYGSTQVFNEYNKVLKAFILGKKDDKDFIKLLKLFNEVQGENVNLDESDQRDAYSC